MKNFLWYQSPITSGKSIYIIDENLSKDIDSVDQNDAIDIALKTQSGSKYKVINNINNQTESMIYIKGEKCLLLKSNFITTDDSNRQIAFMFYTTEIDNAVTELQHYSTLSSMDLQPLECQVLKQTIEKHREQHKKVLIKLISTIVIILIMLILFTLII